VVSDAARRHVLLGPPFTGAAASDFEKMVKREFDMVDSHAAGEQLLHPPKSSGYKEITQLGYLDAYDGVIDKDYAFVVYKEANTKKGEWKLKVRSKQTANTSIDPSHPILRRKMAEAVKAGKEYIVMGFSMTPRGSDPRLVENRIYFNEQLQPQCMQLHLIMRNPDGSPTAEKVIRVAWPE
jgi:hypothetical protein